MTFRKIAIGTVVLAGFSGSASAQDVAAGEAAFRKCQPCHDVGEAARNKLGPILATGNTAVLKPAPDTSWNATRIGRLVAEKTDIPPGVLNIVPASDHFVGEELTLKPNMHQNTMVLEARNVAQSQNTVPWLEIDRDNLKARVVALPKRENIQTPVFNEQLIVELYSK